MSFDTQKRPTSSSPVSSSTIIQASSIKKDNKNTPKSEPTGTSKLNHSIKNIPIIQTKPSVQQARDESLERERNLESKLDSTKGGGSPLPNEVRSFMEPRFERNFSHVVQQTGANKIQNKFVNPTSELEPSIEYKPVIQSKLSVHQPGKQPLMGMAKPVIKQSIQREEIQTKCESCQEEEKIQRLSNDTPDVKSNFIAKLPVSSNPLTDDKTIQREEEGDNSGLLGPLKRQVNGVVDSLRSGWGNLSQTAESSFQSITGDINGITDGLKDVVSSAISSVSEGWTSVQQLATNLTNGIKQQLKEMTGSITGMTQSIAQAVKNMDANALRSAWGKLTGTVGTIWQRFQQTGQNISQQLNQVWNGLGTKFNGVFETLRNKSNEVFQKLATAAKGLQEKIGAIWNNLTSKATEMSGLLGKVMAGLKAVLSKLISWGQKIWQDIQARWTALSSRIASFAQQLQKQISDITQGLRNKAAQMWESMQGLWSKLQSWVKKEIDTALGKASTLWKQISKLDITQVIDFLENKIPLLKAAMQAAQNPDIFLQPLAQGIAATLQGLNPKSGTQGVLSQNVSGGAKSPTPKSSTGNTVIQRHIDPNAKQTTQLNQPLNFDTLVGGVVSLAGQTWDKFNFLSTVKEMLTEVIFFWKSIPKHWHQMTDDLGKVSDRIKSGLGFWRHLLDIPLIILRAFNSIAGIIMAWVTVIAPLVGGIAGALGGTAIIGFFSGGTLAPVGGVGGAIAGAGAGLGWAMAISAPLVAVFIATEVASLTKSFIELWTIEQTEQEQKEDTAQVLSSSLAVLIAGALMAIGTLGSKLAESFGLSSKLLANENIAKFIEGFEAGAKKGGGKLKPTDEPNEDPNSTAKPGDFTPEEIQTAQAKAQELSKNPKNIRPIEDPVYDAEIDLGDGKKYRHKKDSSSWCLFKNPIICEQKIPNLNSPEELKAFEEKFRSRDITDEVRDGRKKPPGKDWKQTPNWQKWIDGGGRIIENPLPDESIILINKDGVSVRFDKFGEPDFSPHLNDPWNIKQVALKEGFSENPSRTARYSEDFEAANKEAGHSEWKNKSPDNYTWHHKRDGKTLQLVPKLIHDTFGHLGGNYR